jgi:hypothetical protein
MKYLFILALAAVEFSMSAALHADTATYDSVEWLTSIADQIGVYRVEQISGPHSVTNSHGNSSCCFCAADFTLQRTIRGSPLPAFSRRRQVEKPDMLGFHSGDHYVFFFVSEARRHNVTDMGNLDVDECFFSMWDYIWLERPRGTENGVAIDHNGKLLTKPEEILDLVQVSLKLPRATTGPRYSFVLKNQDVRLQQSQFHIIGFPTRETDVANEVPPGETLVAGTNSKPRLYINPISTSWAFKRAELVVPDGLDNQNLPKTNIQTGPVRQR